MKNSIATARLQQAFNEACPDSNAVAEVYAIADEERDAIPDPAYTRMDDFLSNIEAHLQGNPDLHVTVPRWEGVNNGKGEVTLLEMAIACRHLSALNHLLDYGAEIAKTNKAGRNGLMAVYYIQNTLEESACETEENDLAIFQRLLAEADNPANHFDYHAVDHEGNGLLHAAARNNSSYFVSELLKRGVNPNIKNNMGDTPLHYCGRPHHHYYQIDDSVYRALLAHEPNEQNPHRLDIHALNNKGQTVFYNLVNTAGLFEHAEVSQLLRNKGTRLNVIDNKGRNLIHTISLRKGETSANDEANIIHDCIRDGVDINAKDYKNNTALRIAVNVWLHIALFNDDEREPHQQGYRLANLLDAGANPNEKDAHGRTVLDYVVQRAYSRQLHGQRVNTACDMAMIAQLVAYGAIASPQTLELLNRNERYKAVYQNTLYNKENVLKKQCAFIPSPSHNQASSSSTTNTLDETDLIQSLKYQRPHQFAALMDAQDMALRQREIEQQKPASQRVLIPDVIDIHAKDHAGRTALHYAVLSHHIAAARRLLAHGAMVNAADNNGFTPADHALIYSTPDMLTLLVSHGAKITAASSAQRSFDMFDAIMRGKQQYRIAQSYSARILQHAGHNDGDLMRGGIAGKLGISAGRLIASFETGNMRSLVTRTMASRHQSMANRAGIASRA